MLNWLMNHVFDRAGHREWLAACAEFDAHSRRFEALEQRIAANFTPQEWAAVTARCEAKLAQAMGTEKSKP